MFHKLFQIFIWKLFIHYKKRVTMKNTESNKHQGIIKIYKKYQSSRKSIIKLEKALLQLKKDLNLSEVDFFNLHICIYEIFVNAVYHGNNIDPSKFVELFIETSNDSVKVMVIDQGKGFSLENVADPLSSENILRDSGRGIFIVKNYAKTFDFKLIPRGFCAILTFEFQKNNPP